MESAAEDRAKFLFTCHGYRIKDGAIWATKSDEPEIGWEGVRIGTYTGDYAEAYRLMIAHRFPTSVIQCVECHDVDVAELGDMCDGCSRETSNWEKAGEFV
jgi:hypothetical protein